VSLRADPPFVLPSVYLVIEGVNEASEDAKDSKKIKLALEAANKETRDNWILGLVQTAKLYGQRIIVHK
jgi:hypothetical protein